MVSKDSDRVVLWPHFFDAKRSRQAGRRVAAAMAVDGPDASWVASAAKKAGLDPVKEDYARHSAQPWEPVGRVLVIPRGSKEATIRLVAEQMAAAQAEQQAATPKRKRANKKRS